MTYILEFILYTAFAVLMLFALVWLMFAIPTYLSDWAEKQGGAVYTAFIYITIFGFFIAVLATCVS
jgi:hypothetical protein